MLFECYFFILWIVSSDSAIVSKYDKIILKEHENITFLHISWYINKNLVLSTFEIKNLFYRYWNEISIDFCIRFNVVSAYNIVYYMFYIKKKCYIIDNRKYFVSK